MGGSLGSETKGEEADTTLELRKMLQDLRHLYRTPARIVGERGEAGGEGRSWERGGAGERGEAEGEERGWGRGERLRERRGLGRGKRLGERGGAGGGERLGCLFKTVSSID